MMIPDIHLMIPWLAWAGFGLALLGTLLFWWTEKRSCLKTALQKDMIDSFGGNRWLHRIRITTIFAMVWLLCIIAAGPYTLGSEKSITKDGIDIVLVVDVSGSMDFTDFSPSRMEKAKQTLRDFTSSIHSDRVGLVVFAGKPISSQLLTFDYAIIDETIAGLSSDIIDQKRAGLSGTNIGDALLLGSTLFDHPEREKVMILVTDGDANSGADPNIVADLLKQKSITVYPVGIGHETESYQTVQNGFFAQKIAIPELNTALLSEIANKTDGVFFRAGDSDTLEKIFEKLREIQTTEITTEVSQYQDDAHKYFLVVLILLSLLFITTELIYPRCK